MLERFHVCGANPSLVTLEVTGERDFLENPCGVCIYYKVFARQKKTSSYENKKAEEIEKS